MAKHKPLPAPNLVRIIAKPMVWLATLLYNVRSTNHEKLPRGGALLLANHLSYIDAVLLQLACPRRIRLVGDAQFLQTHAMQIHWLFRLVYKLSGTVPVSESNVLESTRVAISALQAGEYVLMFPEGGVSRTGQLMGLKRSFEIIVKKANVPVIPVAHDGIWGSVFSHASNNYLRKAPRIMRTHISVVWGNPIPAEEANVTRVRRALLDLGAEAFSQRPYLKRYLGRVIARSLARRPWKLEIIDRTAARTPYRAGKLLAAASAFSRHIRKTMPEQRIGIVLPPGAGGTIANLAVIFAGKVPVNLNFTAGRAALEASIRISGLKTIITADAMKEKVQDFPWVEDTRDFKTELIKMGGKKAVIPWLLSAWLLPNQLHAALLNMPRQGDNAEVALLFTSGSSGEPKGVSLTHRNILANCLQIASMTIVPTTAVVLGFLPIFHSFGFILTVFPLIRGCRTVTVPSPLDTRKIIDAIYQDKVTTMVAAPTFLRPILKKAERHELASLQVIVSGAERMPLDVHDSFVATFGHEIMQGYGLTETSPVCAVNQPDPEITSPATRYQPGNLLGSVGRMLPGITTRILNPDTREEIDETQTGIICFRGSNVFGGYLHTPKQTAEAFENNWFVTGDLGHFDSDGFLFIEGRLSRFSKLAGEMVPHETIESRINEAYNVDTTAGYAAIIIGVTDATKGEALVLITTLDTTLSQLREKLTALGLPNLWIPREIIRVPQIPILGSGKLDMKTCKELAQQHHAGLHHAK